MSICNLHPTSIDQNYLLKTEFIAQHDSAKPNKGPNNSVNHSVNNIMINSIDPLVYIRLHIQSSAVARRP